MNPKSYLLKLLPLITFITVLFPTSNVAQAANSESVANYSETYIAAAPAGDGASKKKVKRIVLSEKAKRIEFIVFGSFLGLGILAPELFFNKKKQEELSSNEVAHNNNNHSTSSQEAATAKKPEKAVKPDMEFLDIISKTAKNVDSFFEPTSSNGKVATKTGNKSA